MQAWRACSCDWFIKCEDDTVTFKNGSTLFSAARADLQAEWSETSFRIQSLRDNPECAQQEFDRIKQDDKGLSVSLSYDPSEDISAPYINQLALKSPSCVSRVSTVMWKWQPLLTVLVLKRLMFT